MNWNKLLLSKWLIYVSLGLVLVLFMLVVFPVLKSTGIINQDLTLNLFSETWGLLFTLLFFVILFEVREFLEWKKVETKVNKRIGREIYRIFVELSQLCEVNKQVSGADYNLSALKDLWKRQLEQLTTKEVVLEFGKELLGKAELAKSYASLIESLSNALSGVEAKYLKYFGSNLQSSLIDIEEELDRIHFVLKKAEIFGSKDEDTLRKSIQKIMEEIVKIRDNKIDIGF